MGAQTGLAALCAFVLAAMCLDGATAQRDCYGAVVEVAVLLRGEHTPLEGFYGYPAPFGAFAAGLLNDTAWPGAAVAVAEPLEACGPIEPPVQPGAAAVVARGNCSFAEKAWAVQKAGYATMLLFNTAPECVFMQAFQNETQGLSIAVVSLTAQAGAGLQALAAQYPGAGQLALRLRLPAEAAVDWSTLALWAMAVGTVTVGALWAGHGNWALGRDGGTPGKKGVELPSITVGPHAAVGFVALASSMLLLLFFFLDKWLVYILVGLFGLGACQSVTMCLYSAAQHYGPAQWRAAHVRTPVFGMVPVNGVAALAVASAVCGTWAAYHGAPWSWPLQDFMGVCFMLTILKQFSLPNLKVASLLLCLAFVYDVWWVFLQPLVTGGGSVMIEVATGGATHEQLPMVLRVPHNALGTNPAFAILGLGDVVLPGLLIVFCRRFDLVYRLGGKQAYFLPAVAGYAGGMLMTYCALWFSWFGDQGQPALLYLVPCTLGSIATLGASRGQLGVLWDVDFDELADRAEHAREESRHLREAEAGRERLLGAGSSPRERLLPPSPFDRSRSSSRDDARSE